MTRVALLGRLVRRRRADAEQIVGSYSQSGGGGGVLETVRSSGVVILGYAGYQFNGLVSIAVVPLGLPIVRGRQRRVGVVIDFFLGRPRRILTVFCDFHIICRCQLDDCHSMHINTMQLSCDEDNSHHRSIRVLWHFPGLLLPAPDANGTKVMRTVDKPGVFSLSTI